MQNINPISTKDLRDNLAEILEKVDIGKQSFLVSKFGRQKALIIPVEKKTQSIKKPGISKLSAFGIWKDNLQIKNSSSWIDQLRNKESNRKI